MRRRLRSGAAYLLLEATLLLVIHHLDHCHSFVPRPAPAFRVASTLEVSGGALPDSRDTIWKWNGHEIYSEVATPTTSSTFGSSFGRRGPDGNKPAAVLIHGFGCSTTYWRETAKVLTEEGYEVHALDLLGQGRSAKPGMADGVEYSINLWAELVDSYVRENVEGKNRGVVLFGNSLGSLVALSAATRDFSTAAADGGGNSDGGGGSNGRVRGICMFNCGVGLNSKNIANEPQRSALERFLIKALLDVLDVLIFNNRALLRYVLEEVVTRELLGDTLRALYKVDPGRVDDELVESFYLPAKDDGSAEALSQIYTNDPGATPMDLHAKHAEFLEGLPIHLVWGDEDAVTPLEGGVGQFYLSLSNEADSNVSFNIVKGGHVPFDDNPGESNGAMLRWLDEVVEKETGPGEKAFARLGSLFGGGEVKS